MKALLVIDMQNDLCRDARRCNKVDAMLPHLRSAIRLFTEAGHPVCYICFSLPADDEQFKRFGDQYCIEGTAGAQIIPELQPLQGPVIFKRKHSAFFETQLDQWLQKTGAREVFLAGLQTHICIMTTAADASFRGYRPVAIRECVVSSNDANRDDALKWIANYVGEVASLSQVEQELRHGS